MHSVILIKLSNNFSKVRAHSPSPSLRFLYVNAILITENGSENCILQKKRGQLLRGDRHCAAIRTGDKNEKKEKMMGTF